MKPLIIIKEYKLFNVIGKGSFGEVFLTQKDNDPKKKATKRLDFKRISDDLKKYLANEIHIMKELNHPNIIHLEAIIPSAHHYYVIMEYCNGGDLSVCLKKYGKPFNQEIIQHFMRQIVEGLKYLHSLRIIHRDIKLENILVNFKNDVDKDNLNFLASEVKIIDFGLARKLDLQGLASTALGSPINMDPIILKKYNKAGGFEQLQKYNEKADIWSLGMVCYQMLTGELAFKAINLKDLIAKIEKGNYVLPINDELSNEIISFINSMLQYDAKTRFSAEELSKHDFLTKNVKDFTKADLNSLSHKISGNYITISTKEILTMCNTINKANIIKKDSKEQKEIEIYINSLLEEYNAAKDYFKENNLIERQENTNKICEKIKQIKNQYEMGNNNILKCLPKPITPEFIYGCTIEEYKYKEILSKKLNDKKVLESKIKSFIVNTFNLNNEQKVLYEKYKAELNKLNINLKELENNFNNIWSPAPEYIKESNESQPKNNYNLIQIYIKKTDIIKENLNLIVTLKNDQLIMNNKEVKLNIGNNFNDKWEWKISINDWINIDKFYLKIENDYKLPDNRKPFKIRVGIGKIKNGKGIAFNSAIPETNNEIIQTTVYPIINDGKSFMSKESKDNMNIKILKPFKGKNFTTKKIPNLEKL